MPTDSPSVTVVADYLTQRGGAERVVLAMLHAYPDSEILTAAYEPDSTYPELRGRTVRTLWPDRVPVLRKDPRLAFPVLASAWNSSDVSTEVALVSSSGWAHGVRGARRTVVYCHNPARWLYQPDDYFQGGLLSAARPFVAAAAPALRRWDSSAARRADVYLANSTTVQRRIKDVYGIEAQLLHPPVMLDATSPLEPVPGLEPGYLLTVSRARAYKNTALVATAVAGLPDARLVVVGQAPEDADPRRVTSVSGVSDAQLRWLYANAEALVAASHEDFGLTPVEAATFGTPVVALRFGGYLDSVEEGVTGVFFEEETPASVRGGIQALRTAGLDRGVVAARAERFSLARFTERLHQVVADAVG